MAQFTMDLAGIDGDAGEIKAHLIKLNRNLEYMFSHLTPEENYSKEAYEHYLQDGEKSSLIEQSVKQIKLEMLTSGNVISAINLSSEGVKILGEKISLEGVVTVNGYFKVGLDGSIEARHARFSGDISASNISGSAITIGGSGNSGELVVYDELNQIAVQMDADGISIFKGDISIGYFTISENSAIFGPFSITSYDSATGRYVMESEYSTIGFSNVASSSQLWMWAGYDRTEGTYQFLVNGSGFCAALDFGIMDGSGGWEITSLKQTLSDISDKLQDLQDQINDLTPNP